MKNIFLLSLVVFTFSNVSLAGKKSPEELCQMVIFDKVLSIASSVYAVDGKNWKDSYMQDPAVKLVLKNNETNATESQSYLQTWAVFEEYMGGYGTKLVVTTTPVAKSGCKVEYVGVLDSD